MFSEFGAYPLVEVRQTTIIYYPAQEVFRETIQTEGALPKFITKLTDSDPYIRAAALAALQALSTHGKLVAQTYLDIMFDFFTDIYWKNINLSIPTIIKQLDDESWIIRQQAMGMLALLSKQGTPAPLNK